MHSGLELKINYNWALLTLQHKFSLVLVASTLVITKLPRVQRSVTLSAVSAQTATLVRSAYTSSSFSVAVRMSCESETKSSSRSPLGVVLRLYTTMSVPDGLLILSNCRNMAASSLNGEYFSMSVISVLCCIRAKEQVKISVFSQRSKNYNSSTRNDRRRRQRSTTTTIDDDDNDRRRQCTRSLIYCKTRFDSDRNVSISFEIIKK